ncbi:MAG: hypothetical protein K2M73_09520 [Lachnospiraceae bacterium]|nr:hypothetical protein [Lachnospiraceae bacterium]
MKKIIQNINEAFKETELLDIRDLNKVIDQKYSSSNIYANAMVLLTYMMNAQSNTKMEVINAASREITNVGDMSQNERLVNFLSEYIYHNFIPSNDCVIAIPFNLKYNIPILFRFIGAATTANIKEILNSYTVSGEHLFHRSEYVQTMLNDAYDTYTLQLNNMQCFDIIKYGLQQASIVAEVTDERLPIGFQTENEYSIQLLTNVIEALSYYVLCVGNITKVLNNFADYISTYELENVFSLMVDRVYNGDCAVHQLAVLKRALYNRWMKDNGITSTHEHNGEHEKASEVVDDILVKFLLKLSV